MKVSELITYLQAVQEEAGDIPIIVRPQEAHSHILVCPEVEDRARYYDGSELKRQKAVVVK